MNILLCLAAPH